MWLQTLHCQTVFDIKGQHTLHVACSAVMHSISSDEVLTRDIDHLIG